MEGQCGLKLTISYYLCHRDPSILVLPPQTTFQLQMYDLKNKYKCKCWESFVLADIHIHKCSRKNPELKTIQVSSLYLNENPVRSELECGL